MLVNTADEGKAQNAAGRQVYTLTYRGLVEISRCHGKAQKSVGQQVYTSTYRRSAGVMPKPSFIRSHNAV